MYRVESWEDLYSCGFFDYKELGGVIAAEWSENIEGALESDTVDITVERDGSDENKRIITLTRE